MMRQFHTKHPRKLKLLLVLAVPAATLACKPARSANLTATLTAPDTTSESNEAHFAALNDTENSLSKCEYYLSYNYNSPDSDSYSAQRAGIFPQSSDFLRTSIELWHSGISDLSSAANKCKIKIPYIERVSIVYSEYLKSQCVADFFRMNNQNIIRISSKHNGSHSFNGVIQPDSKIHFLIANSVTSLEDFFVWFARNGATQCKKKGGWLSPMGKIESTLHEIVNRPVSYDKVSSDRIEILPEFHASLGNILAKRFLKILSSQIRFKALNQ